jgi:hypothetical protein
LNENSLPSVAKYTPTGILTNPKLILPFHVFEAKQSNRWTFVFISATEAKLGALALVLVMEEHYVLGPGPDFARLNKVFHSSLRGKSEILNSNLRRDEPVVDNRGEPSAP